jgi:hypothetical protein
MCVFRLHKIKTDRTYQAPAIPARLKSGRHHLLWLTTSLPMNDPVKYHEKYAFQQMIGT